MDLNAVAKTVVFGPADQGCCENPAGSLPNRYTPMKNVVIVTCPGQKPRQFVLKGKRIGLGRGEDNDICLDVESVSSSHLEFGKTEDGYEIKDLSSTNGTRVNGKKVETVPLVDGDRILIGETVPAHFLLLADGETWEATTAEGSAEDQKGAAEFVTMSDKLEKLEANIEEKHEEAAMIEAQLVELRVTHQKNLTEFAEAQLALDALQREIDDKKNQSTTSAAELQQLEESLLENTQKVKLMSTHLASQQQEISQLEQQGPVMPRQNPHAPPAEQPAPAPAQAPPQLPPAQQTAAPQQQVPPIPAAPAPTASVPVTPAPPGARKPTLPKPPVGPQTVKLMKQGGPATNQPASPAAPRIVKRKRT
jgi:hypothetical protein